MYNEFYGFKEDPFNITPNPRFIFYSDKHRDAFNHLLFGITQRKGFIVLTGEVGTGKTTLCRALLNELGPKYKTGLVLNPCMSWPQLLRAVLAEFGLKPERENDRFSMLEALNAFLLEQVGQGNDVVLIIDEAQDMSLELLEQIRLLSNLETDDRKLLQIILMGQPELRDKLARPELRQLKQRITVQYHLQPLSREEMNEYIRHRLQVCGANGRPKFGAWARWKIYRYSKGVPRLVNAVCDKTLLCGFVTGSDCFSLKHVRRAIHELEGKAA